MPRDPSRTEKATPKRREKAREKGSVARSQELPKITVLLAGVLALRFLIGRMGEEVSDTFVLFLGQRLAFEATPGNVYSLMLFLSQKLAFLLLPLLLILAAVAYVTQRYQVGPLWVPKVFELDFSKIFNPMNALKKLLINRNSLVQIGKQVAMAAIIALGPYLVLRKEFASFFPLFYADVATIAATMLTSGFTMILYTMVPMIAVAILDVWYTRWDYEENLMMTKDEVKDEARQADGDPQVKQQQRKKMFEVMQKRMLENVPKADVIITNPTHIACALRYDPATAPAPILLAKGLDHLAEKIKEIAREHRIPIRENKPLAQALYKSVEVGETIPEELYQAVAAVLAQLDKFKRNKRPG